MAHMLQHLKFKDIQFVHNQKYVRFFCIFKTLIPKINLQKKNIEVISFVRIRV